MFTLLLIINVQFEMLEAKSTAVYSNEISLLLTIELFNGFIKVITGGVVSCPMVKFLDRDAPTFAFVELSVQLTCHL